MKRVLVALVLAGCAAPTAQLSPEMLARLQRESRVEIYDRENDVVIARNKEDETRRRITALSTELDRLAGREKKLEQRVAKAGGAATGGVRKTVAARRSYLEAQRRLATAELAVSSETVATASARLEQTRQRQLIRTGRALAATIKPFDARVEHLDKHVRELERREQDLHLETESAFQSWKNAEDDYAKATGDYDTGIWLD